MHPNELLKIPFFIQHYKIHKSQNDRINIWSFLCDHYTKGNHKEVEKWRISESLKKTEKRDNSNT